MSKYNDQLSNFKFKLNRTVVQLCFVGSKKERLIITHYFERSGNVQLQNCFNVYLWSSDC